MISARTRVMLDRLNMAMAWLVTVLAFAFVVGLVVGVPGVVALFDWLAVLGSQPSAPPD